MVLLKKAAWSIALLWAVSGSTALFGTYYTAWHIADYRAVVALYYEARFPTWAWLIFILGCSAAVVRWRAFAPWR